MAILLIPTLFSSLYLYNYIHHLIKYTFEQIQIENDVYDTSSKLKTTLFISYGFSILYHRMCSKIN